MRVVNNNAKSRSGKSPEKYLYEAERGKKQMYLEACIQQHRHFSPFVALVDGMLGVEATETLKRISSRLATKLRKPYSRKYGYIKSRIAINLVHTTYQCIQGSRVMAHRISVHWP